MAGVIAVQPERLDLAGIGFGPANLALAVALAETRGHPLDAWRFWEAKSTFSWHSGMLLPQARMQISFLKDLVSSCDPTSRFTFLNYLHGKGRLRGFINQQNFQPSRQEFQDYLRWAADAVASHVTYGQRLQTIEPVIGKGGRIVRLRLRAGEAGGDAPAVETHSLVVATGGVPSIPAVFVPVADHSAIIHSARYLPTMDSLTVAPARIAVVGAGQSAAEIMLDLHRRCPEAQIDLLYRGTALRVADASPFVNEIFEPEMIDFLYGQPPQRQRDFLAEFRHTNYAAIDAELLRDLSDRLYQQKVLGCATRLRLCPRRTIIKAAAASQLISITSRDGWTGESEEKNYDLVVLATGYDRSGWRKLMEPLWPWLGEGTIGRDWRLAHDPQLIAPVYIQGGAEQSHGIGDTLLSHLPERARTILASLTQAFRAGDAALVPQHAKSALSI